MARVFLEGVSKQYSPEQRAVTELTLEVADREFLVLVGPSGCGKTTTLRMIAGLESISSGRILIGDREVQQVPPKDRDIAMVFQNYALYPHMSVYKNMSFGLELRNGGGWISRLWRRIRQPEVARRLEERRREIPQKVQAAAESLGIEKLLQRKPHQLSGGERQRVALGRSIVREPAAFLFDEPLSNLDARLRAEMRGELRRLHRQLQTTMIYVTHDQVEALTLGDRVAVMRGGQLLQVGPPMEVYDEPVDTFVASFLGSPGMNLLDGWLSRQADGWLFELSGESVDGTRLSTVDGESHRVDGESQRVGQEELSSQRNRQRDQGDEKGKSIERGGDSPPRLMIDSTLLSSEVRATVEQELAQQEAGGRVRMLLGVRPEDLSVSASEQEVPGPAANETASAIETASANSGVTSRGLANSEATSVTRMTCEVVAVDRLGDSAMLYLRLPGTTGEEGGTGRLGKSVGLAARAWGRFRVAEGANVELAFDLGRVHFFDRESGINLVKVDRS